MLASQAASVRRFGFFSPDIELGPEREAGESPMSKETHFMNYSFIPEREMTIRLERLRVQEALAARDAAVERLAEACTSIRQKTAKIARLTADVERLEKELESVTHASVQGTAPAAPTAEVSQAAHQALEGKFASLTLSMSENRPLSTRENMDIGYKSNLASINMTFSQDTPSAGILKDVSNTPSSLIYATSNMPKELEMPDSPWTSLDGERVAALPTASTAEKIEGRYAVLASLPLPSGIPDDALTPIVIPAPYTLHDFIGTTSGLLRSQVGNYRVFQQSTTTWCPEREEHGYYLTPVFKCSTNPRVNAAHRWSAVDLAAKLDRPTECFFNKDGKWYYAGIYKTLRLEDLCPQEWECLSTEARSSPVMLSKARDG
ncbi:hypothetical protein BV20DRAFT_977736 [Pilatotrama ljubarskyi]|nr:hypothetical protein BV20DRAFT_977736 [Pilatotrama ljubarskyi]